MKDYFISYAYGGIRHAHNHTAMELSEINKDNIYESMSEMKLHIMEIHSDCNLTSDLIDILCWKEL